MISEPLSARAYAKINLTLHVTGQRADGYHLLDSLVVRVDVADRLTVAAAEALTMDVTGPRASDAPRDDTNLVLRAARLLAPKSGARITLEKHLPAAAGIGGGSADAAAALTLLSALWKVPLPSDLTVLGADVPVCMAEGPQRMGGIGAHLTPFAGLPDCALVLVNPGVPAPTAAVFARLAGKDSPPMPDRLPAFANVPDLADWLADQRNDLEEPARLLAPEIGAVLSALTPQVRLARMSGSGATCFGLCDTEAEAAAVAARLAKGNPGWWVASGRILA